jgi:hypothetical protein
MALPAASAIGAVSIAKTTAILTGKVLNTGDFSDPCQCRFRYRALGGDYSYTDWEGSYNINDMVSKRIIGLAPSTWYEFAIQARQEGGM